MAALGETTKPTGSDRLRIVHVMRAPVGGLFRHVVDLANAQAAAGHLVGIIADSATGGDAAKRVFDELAPALALGLTRLPMQRLPHPGDLFVARRVARLLQHIAPDIAHGHGAKGGLYVRLPALLPGLSENATRRYARAYTPHGGSLHYSPKSIGGALYLLAERKMARVTDLFLFESDFARRRFAENVGPTPKLAAVVYNGLGETEFEPVSPAPDAADFLFIGELRLSKGVDTLIRAFAQLAPENRLALVGAGPDEGAFRKLASELNVSSRVAFHPSMPARDALLLGRILVVPSHAESMPYIVLEGIAARAPIVATNVGGAPEIFGPNAHLLVPPADVDALAQAMRRTQEAPAEARDALIGQMADYVRARFTLAHMVDGVFCGYCSATPTKKTPSFSTSTQLRAGD